MDNKLEPIFYRVESPINTYFIKVDTYINLRNKQIEKYVINLDRCVTISLSLENQNKIAQLESLFYESRCNILHNLERGVGTRDMLNTALMFCKELFVNNIKGFKLHDKSYNNVHGRDDLFISYICLYGKTWYETYFNAQFNPRINNIEVFNQYIDAYNTCLKKTTSELFKKTISVETFQDIIGVNFELDIIYIYENSKCFCDFFKLILLKYNNNYSLYNKNTKYWQEKYVRKIVFDNYLYLMNEYYYIPINKTNYDGKIRFDTILKNNIPNKNQFGGDTGKSNKNNKRKLIYNYSHIPIE